MIQKKLLVGLVSAMVLSLPSMPAFADGHTPSAGVTAPANVTITTFRASAFGVGGTVLLTGLRQTVTATVADITLVDARGTGAGWSVNLTASQFTNSGATNAGERTLPHSSLLLGSVSIVADGDATPVTGVAAVAAVVGPPATEAVVAVAAIAVATSTIDKVGGVKILNNPINGGMGTYVISMTPMTLTLLPRNVKAGSYTSTITMTLSQGPV